MAPPGRVSSCVDGWWNRLVLPPAGYFLCAQKVPRRRLLSNKKPHEKSSVRTHRAFHHSDCAGNLTGTQASGTNIYMAGRTINHCLDALDIGLPRTIGTSVGVGNLDPKGNALVAKLAFSHPLHLLAVTNIQGLHSQAFVIIADTDEKCKSYLQRKRKKFAQGCGYCEKAGHRL